MFLYGKRFVSCSARFRVVWQTLSNASLEEAAVLRGHANSISAVHAVSGGVGGGVARAYTGDWSGHVCMWDVACLGEGSAEANSGGASTTQVCACVRELRRDRVVVVVLGEGNGGVVGRVVALHTTSFSRFWSMARLEPIVLCMAAFTFAFSSI